MDAIEIWTSAREMSLQKNTNFLRYNQSQKRRGFANFLHRFVIMRESRWAINGRRIRISEVSCNGAMLQEDF